MKTLITIIFFSLVTSGAKAEACRHFEIRGELELQKGQPVIVVARDTQSEKTLNLSSDDILTLTPYMKKSIRGHFIKTQKGLELIGKPELMVPDPLNPAKDSYVTEKEEGTCAK